MPQKDTNYDALELHKRVRFFIENMGLQPWGGERAVELARAEHAAEQGDYTYTWAPSSSPDTSWMSADTYADFLAGRLYVSTCHIWHRVHGGVHWPLSYMDNIVHVHPLDSPAHDITRRLVEADLARMLELGVRMPASPLESDERLPEDAHGELVRQVG